MGDSPTSPDIAVVTGAGTGIGAAIARRLSAAGFDVALLGRRPGPLASMSQELERAGGRGVPITCDVTDEASIAEAFAAIHEQLGVPLVMVNNAGVLRPIPILSMSAADWDAMVNSNLRGTFLCTAAAARLMVEGGRGGSIVNVASMLGEVPVKLFAAYGASKAGILYFTKVAAIEFAKHRIRVNAVLPGYVDTPMSEAAQDDPVVMAKILERIPHGRMAQPEEVAELVAYVASPVAEYMTGSSLLIDGGYSLRA